MASEALPTFHALDSAMVSGAAYEAGVLWLRFRRGNLVYRYKDVPAKVVEGLWAAQSKGQYLRAYVLGKYPSEKVGG